PVPCFFSLPPRPQRSPLFPYTTLFRSQSNGPYSLNNAKFLPLAALQDVTVQVLVLVGNNSSTQSTLLGVHTSNPAHFHLRASNKIGRAHVYSSHVKISYAVFCLNKKTI